MPCPERSTVEAGRLVDNRHPLMKKDPHSTRNARRRPHHRRHFEVVSPAATGYVIYAYAAQCMRQFAATIVSQIAEVCPEDARKACHGVEGELTSEPTGPGLLGD